MRNIILSAVLGLTALGLVGATASEAKAYWPPRVYGNQIGPYYSNSMWVGYPTYRYWVGPYSANAMYAMPGYYRTFSYPNAYGATYRSPSIYGTAYNPVYGLYNYYVTPAFIGYSNSRYYGYQRYSVPSMTFAAPASYGYGATYVPSGYILP